MTTERTRPGREGGESLVEDLRGEVALVVEELEVIVVVDGEGVGEEVVLVVDGAGGGAKDDDEDEDGDDAATEPAAHGWGAGGGALDRVLGDIVVERPLGEEDEAGEYEESGPPAAVGVGEA